MGTDYYGDFVCLGPTHYGCNNCGAEFYCVGEPRWCTRCQYFIWDDEMERYRKLCAELHSYKEDIYGLQG